MNTTSITETDLHAYVDGELPAARHAEVQAWLHDNPAEAERVTRYRLQKEQLRSLFDPVLDEPVPDSLRNMLLQSPANSSTPARKRITHYWPALAASLALIVISATLGWLAHERYATPATLAQGLPLPRQAAIAHAVYSPDIRRPVEVDAEHEAQLITWLSKRLGTAVHTPKLNALGFDLIGGRLLPGNSGPVAQLMYQDGSGQRLTLYLSTENTSNRDTAFRFAQEGQLNVFYWIDGKFGYALSGAIPRQTLGQIARSVYEQLNPR